MYIERMLPFTLCASVLIHACAVILFSGLSMPFKEKKRNLIAISYVRNFSHGTLKKHVVPDIPVPVEQRLAREKVTGGTRNALLPEPRISSTKRNAYSLPYSTEDKIFQVNKPAVKMNDFSKPQTASIVTQKKPVDLSDDLTVKKIDSPSYEKYTVSVRSRIRQMASFHYNKTDVEGSVIVSFVLTKTGKLKNYWFETGSSGSQYLRDIVVKTISCVSLFPPFPQDFNVDEHTFRFRIVFNKSGKE
ncbi:MAG: TonB C-terminal domain-containing protein [Candidatus Omnitrophica bacterium]|nr:TonB C-terminal domain-containing protein [Candidatus Omnitrophota bacterium]